MNNNKSFKDPHKVWKTSQPWRTRQGKRNWSRFFKMLPNWSDPLCASINGVSIFSPNYALTIPPFMEWTSEEKASRWGSGFGSRTARFSSPFNQIPDNLVHELCHYDHGPHDETSYDLLDQVKKEGNELLIMAKGNSTVMKSLRPREAAAMAAERRLRAFPCCGTSVSFDSVQSRTSKLWGKLFSVMKILFGFITFGIFTSKYLGLCEHQFVIRYIFNLVKENW